MKIAIITSCTGQKKYKPDNQLTQEDFRLIHDREAFKRREDELRHYRTPAADLYTGQQHLRLMEGVQYFRTQRKDSQVDLWIVSAGYGVIPEGKEIVPYNCTFQGMKPSEIRAWAEHLGISHDIRQLFLQPADFFLVLLGTDYLQALSLSDNVNFNVPTVFICSKSSERYVRGQGLYHSLMLTRLETKQFKCGFVGLKGEFVKQFLLQLSEAQSNVTNVFNSQANIRHLLDGVRARSF